MGKLLRNGTLIALALLWLIPTYLLVINASAKVETYTGLPYWAPTNFDLFTNIATVWNDTDVGRAMLNSLTYAIISALLAVVLATMAAFGVVVTRVRHRSMWFWLIYAGTLLPLQVFLRPLFSAYASMDLYDTKVGMFLLYIAICIPFAFFLLRNYILTIPRETTEAARLDGASWWTLFWRVHVPLAKSAMIAAFVFQFVWVWNDLLFGITFTTGPANRPVMAALSDLQGTYSNYGPPVVLAGAVLASLPAVLVFFVAQRYFVSSLKLSA